MNYDAAFKNIDDTLWKDAGCGSELDYIEQTSWILFLKYLDDLEKEKQKVGRTTCVACQRQKPNLKETRFTTTAL